MRPSFVAAACAATLSTAAAGLPPTAAADAAPRRVSVPISTVAGVSGGGAANLLHTSSDGTRVLFATSESLLAEDDDGGSSDIYQRRGATLELISRGADVEPGSPRYKGASADGTKVWFEADEDLLGGGDGDFGNAPDLYERSGGVTRLLTKPVNPFGFSFSQPSPFIVASSDGAHVLLTTDEPLVAGDNDNADDVYDVGGSVPVLVSVGVGGQGAGALAISVGGSRVFFTTTASLDAADTDSAIDVYERAGGVTTLRTPGTAEELNPRQVTADGDRVFFTSREALTAEDTDGTSRDVYRAEGATLALVSAGTVDTDEAIDADFQKASANGAVAYFTTQETLETTDTDAGVQDIYRNDLGTTRLASTGPNPTGQPDDFLVFSDISADGEQMYWRTSEGFVDDNDGGFIDAYVRDGNATRRLSIGAINDASFADSSFAGFAKDGSRTFFQTDGDFVEGDTDGADDLYERTTGGVTDRLFAPPGECTLLPSNRCLPTWKGNSDDGVRVWVESDEALGGPDDDGDQTDVFESRLVVQPTIGGLSTPLALGEDDPSEPLAPAFTLSGAYDDVFGAVIEVANTADGDDELSFVDRPGITGEVSDGGSKLTLTGRATEAEYQAAIRTIRYRNLDGSPAASRDIGIAIDEGGVLSDPVSRTVAVTAVNDAPQIAVDLAGLSYTENAPAVAVAPSANPTDEDSVQLDSASVSVSGCRRGVDLLQMPAAAGLTAAYDQPSCSLIISGAADVATYRAALRSVAYRNASEDPVPGLRTLTFEVSDGQRVSASATRAVVVSSVNDPATVAFSGGKTMVPAGGASAPVDPLLDVEDLDDSMLLGASVALTGGAGGADGLSLVPPNGITVALSPDGRTLSLGGLASVAVYREALRAVEFRDRSATGTAGERTITVRIDDGQGPGPAATRTLDVGTDGAGAQKPPVTEARQPEPSAPGPPPSPAPVVTVPLGTLSLGGAPRIRGRQVPVACTVTPGAIKRCEIELRRNGKTVARGATSSKLGAPSVLVNVKLSKAHARKLAAGPKRRELTFVAALTLTSGATITVQRTTKVAVR